MPTPRDSLLHLQSVTAGGPSARGQTVNFVDGLALYLGQRGGAGELVCLTGYPVVGDVQAAARLLCKRGDGVEHAAREDQATVEGLVIAVREAGIFQVEARIRCRSLNSELCIDAACRNAAASLGVSSACCSRMPAPSRVRRTGRA